VLFRSFPDQTYCPDGILAAARLVEMVGKRKFSELRDSVPCYPILRNYVEFDPKNREKIMQGLERELEGIECESMMKLDGHRLQFKEGWALVRPSGTEPRIRFLAEARSDPLAHEIMDIVSRKVKECLK
jgi:phosphoglucosamine mutase